MIDKIIEIGIIALLIYTPLAFGGVTPTALAVQKIVSASLLLLWLFKKILPESGHVSATEAEAEHRLFSGALLAKKIFFGSSFLFLGSSYLQSIHLPASFVKILCPSTYALYSEAALNILSSTPSSMPLSIYAYATENEWGKLLSYASVCFLVTRVLRTRKQISRLLHVILAMGCLEASYGFLQFFSVKPLLGLYPTQVNWVGGTFVNKNHFAGYLELVLPLGFALLLTQVRRNGSTQSRLAPEHFRESYPKVFLLLLALFLTIAALFLSGSRGGIASFCCGSAVFILLARQRRLLRRKALLVLIFTLLSVSVTIFLKPDILSKKIYTFGNLESESSFLVRWELWRSAFHIFQDYPLSGAGLGSFSQLNSRYRTFRAQLQHYEYAENDYLQTLSETGLVGSALLIAIGFALGTQLYSRWKQRHSRWKVALVAGGMSGMVSLLIHSGTDFNLRIPSNALLFVTILALCVNIVTLPSSQKNNGSEQEQRPLPTTKRRRSHLVRMALLCPFLVLLLLFLIQTAKRYLAERQYQYAVAQNIPEDRPASAQDFFMPESRDALELALRLAPGNADYSHALGKLFFSLAGSSASLSKDGDEFFRKSETLMAQAISLNPSNPWLYYELGRMMHDRPDLSGARYFRAALENAPKEMFLRQAVGQWFLFYDLEQGQSLMQKLAATDEARRVEDPKVSQDFARLLYDFRLDHDAEQERSRQEGILLSTHCPTNVLSESANSSMVELGNDAGSAEWKAPLKNAEERIRKSICLPENLDTFQYSALKIFMNNGGHKDFTAKISINDHRIKRFEKTIPQLATWYEIPFDIRLLRGRSQLNVYIRVEHASADGNYLQIWGDAQSLNTHSLWNFDTREDLSSHEGIQQGEYLIRLVLER